MKKITILLLLCFCAVGFVQAQQITEDSGTAASYEFNLDNSGLAIPSTWNEVAGTATRLATTTTSQNRAPVTITHSASQTIGVNAIACGTAGVNAENHYYRDFDLANDFGIVGDFNVTSAEFGVQDATDPVVVTVNIWSSTGAAFPAGALVLEGTAVYNSTPADQGTVVSVPVTATIPAGAVMVFEFIQADGSIWRIGSNDLAQTGVTWISSAACNLLDPVDVNSLNPAFDMAVVMNVVGEEAGGALALPIT
ncbi:MAG: hypothetical protein ACKVGT_07840, partial [Flavobacteriales bacterium]